MLVIIDGYNVLHEAGIIDRHIGPGSLHRARLALLNFLVESLDANVVAETVVVFDSKDAPWGLPRMSAYRGLTVHFASKYPDADSLIEELILEESSPKRMTVVSSDHRLQKAARRRKAQAIDADLWYRKTLRARAAKKFAAPVGPERPPVPLLDEDVEYWLRQFGGQDSLNNWMLKEFPDLFAPDPSLKKIKPDPSPIAEESAQEENSPPRFDGSRPPSLPSDQFMKDGQMIDLSNPFPPGYGDDLVE